MSWSFPTWGYGPASQYRTRRLACRLTCAFARCLEAGFHPGGFPHVVAGCRPAVLGSGWAAGAGFAGFRCTGGLGCFRADVPKPAADAGRGQPAWEGGAFPGVAQVSGQSAGQAQLGMAGYDQPGPPVRSVRVADLGDGPPEDLLEQPESVLQVEPAQERLPQPVHLTRSGAGARGPQPDRLGVPVARQMVDLQADQGAFDDGQVAVVVKPGGAVGEPGMQPVPGPCQRGAVPGGCRRCRDRRRGPGGRVGEGELPAVPAGAAPGPRAPFWFGEGEHPVAAEPAPYLHRQGREPGGPGPGGITGGGDARRGRVAPG